MAKRDRRFKVKVLALAGAGFVLLVVDVVILTLVVMPLAASTRTISTGLPARATQSTELALLLPTRDPRTPWPTVTPTPTGTQWPAPATHELPTATSVPAPVGSTALPNSTLAPATYVPEEGTASPQSTVAPAASSRSAKASSSMLITTPTPTLQAAALPPSAPDTGAGPPAETPEPGETPGNAPSETPTATATNTPAANPGETALPPAPPGTFDDLPDFETYLRIYRSGIAGQRFDIVSLTVDRADAALPHFVLEVAGSETDNVFAAQPPAAVLDYGRGFLDDAKRYLGDEHCAVAFVSTYKTSNGDACSQVPAWCQLGTFDQSTNTWTVIWTYVRGSFTGGPYTVEAWNAGP